MYMYMIRPLFRQFVEGEGGRVGQKVNFKDYEGWVVVTYRCIVLCLLEN